MQKSNLQKITKSLIISIFSLLLLASFILINTTSGALFSISRLDLTSDRLNTLSPRTKEILSVITQPIYAKIYLSSQISRQNPVLAQYAQNVIRLLNRFQEQSDHHIKIEIINPEPFSNTENEAKNAGLIPLPENGSDKLYFGAVFSNDKGNSYTIAQFSPNRYAYLENDIIRAVSHILMPERKKIGIASDLPLIDKGFMGKEAQKNWTFVNLLAKDYDIISVPTGIAEIPNVDTMIVVASGKLPSLFIYALDQYILRGGRLLLLVDPASEIKRRLYPDIPDEDSNLEAFLDNIGTNFNAGQIVGDREQAVEADYAAQENADLGRQTYYPWINVNPAHMNRQSPLTAGFDNIFLKSPGTLVLKDSEDHKTENLLTTSENTMIAAAKLAKYGSKAEVLRYMDNQQKAYTLAALSEGNYHTIFAKNPLENSAYSKQLLPFLTTSVAPAQIIVIADTDILDTINWAAGENAGDFAEDDYNLMPTANNFDFIQRAVDYLSGNPGALNIAAKKYTGSRQTIAEIFNKKGMKKYEQQYKDISGELEANQRKLDTVNIMLKSNSAFGTAKTLGEIESLQSTVNQNKNELRRIEYLIKAETTHNEHIIALLYTLVIPIVLLLLIATIHIYFSRRSQRRGRSLINE